MELNHLLELQVKYVQAYYNEGLNTFKAIAEKENKSVEHIKAIHKRIDDYHATKLKLNESELAELLNSLKAYRKFRNSYNSKSRQQFFSNPNNLLKWIEDQKDQCHYCEISQAELKKVVQKRKGNLTLNGGTKRSKGTLEIERKDPDEEYTNNNCVLACPICNNAKSNLISEDQWKRHFVPAVKALYEEILKE